MLLLLACWSSPEVVHALAQRALAGLPLLVGGGADHEVEPSALGGDRCHRVPVGAGGVELVVLGVGV